jgi:4-amino-4-deoxy-L-arabinose transferase-like glycosyltransferase
MATVLDAGPRDDVPPLPPRTEPDQPRPRRPLSQRLLFGREDDPRWARPALLALLTGTAILYLWDLGASGWANSFYSAAVQAGTKSWKAFFFGSSDAANFITVDKPPASLWVMELSARIFGLNAWSILVPQALEGVAAVGALYATVRRWFSPAAALLAGAAMALTPVAALMFRFNNPDALLVLLLVLSAYATVRAVEDGRTRWLVLAGALVGFGFLTKMLQALCVVPAIGVVYLIAGPTQLRKRVAQLCAFIASLIVSAGWWVAAVQLTPASARPYIGGSQDNSLLNLIFGYNGFGRLTGNETGSVRGGGGAGGMWGPTGWNRLFTAEWGGQIAWLLPAALLLLAAGLIVTARARRTDRTRAAFVLWGGWLLVTAAVVSFGQGIIHPYYAVALAPAIGAVVGIGAWTLWTRRSSWFARLALSGTLAVTAVWTYQLLDRTPSWHPALRTTVLLGGLFLAGVLAIAPARWGRALVGLAIGASAIALAAPAAYTLDTVSTPHSGAIPSAGPTVAGALGRGGPRFGGAAGGFGGGTQGGPGGGFGGGGFGTPAGAVNGGGNPAGANPGSLLNGSNPGSDLVALLDTDAANYTWVAATIGSNQASGYQLATGDPVMAIGGFNGTDPYPSLAQFEAYVKAGKVHYFIAGGMGGGPGGGSQASSAITAWVEQNFTSTTVSGVTVYNLRSGANS